MNGGGYGDASPAPSTPNRPRKGYDEQTLIPITIRMALNSESGSTTLSDGRETHQVKVVGAVREVMKQSTNIVYTIEDGTGLIEVKEWCDEANDNPALMQIREEAGQDHVYVRVIGKLQEYDGKKHIIGYSVRKIGSGNELTHHLLEVVHSAEKFKKGNQIVGAPYQVNAPTGVGFGSPQAVTPVKQAVMGMSLGMGGGDGDDLKGSLMQYIKGVSKFFHFNPFFAIDTPLYF